MKPLAPKTLLQKRYDIVQIIGKGGMGEVYLATDTRLGNTVALKRTTVGDDENLAAAFEQEARTLAGLRHPVLPKVSDHFLENEEQFLVMDFIEGEDLSKRLKTSAKPFPLSWVLFWADQLLEALSYLHTHDPPIIHRDIKPQNLKLTPENQIVLLDFGLSKNALGNTRVTTSGSVVGYTPHYAPMEQIRGTGTNAKSDLYALSATLYQLLTNTVPPDALTRADSVLANLPDPLRPLSELNPEISETLAGAIGKGMEISQEKRFSDAREMQKALRRAYSTMQESMAAETVAFNLGDQQDTDGLSESDVVTQVGTDLPIPTSAGHTAGVETEVPAVPPAATAEEASGGATDAIKPPDVADSTVETGSPAQFEEIENEEIEPSGADEESGGEPVGADVAEETAMPAMIAGEQGSPSGGDPRVAEREDESAVSADADEEVTREAVVIPGEPESSGGIDEPEASPETSAAGVASEVAAASPSAPTAVPAKTTGKSSVGKYVAIVFGLGAVLILVLGAVAAGLWYYTQGGWTTGNENTAEPSPTVESTVEDALPTNSTPENVNTENVNVSDENANTGNEEIPSTPVAPPAPGRPTPQGRPTARRTPVPPVKKAPVKPRSTPTPKVPKKKDPGVI